ncbi:MAG: hypothetical protein ACOX0Z_00540 [Candidatus Nanosyncoccaceae bacterium]
MNEDDKPKKKPKFRLIDEPMNDVQVMEWFVFAGGIVGVVVGLLTDKIAISILLGVTFGLLFSMMRRAFRKK